MFADEARQRGMQPYLHTNGDVLKHNDALCEQVTRVYTLIVVGIYDYRSNDELEEAKTYWRKRLAGATLEFAPIGALGSGSAYSIGIPRALVPPDSRLIGPDLTFPNAPCHRPAIRMIIQHDGEMCFCCEDTHGAFNLGNVYRSSLEELWFSQRHVDLVNDLINGMRQKYPLCRKCPLSPTGALQNGEKSRMDRRHTGQSATV